MVHKRYRTSIVIGIALTVLFSVNVGCSTSGDSMPHHRGVHASGIAPVDEGAQIAHSLGAPANLYDCGDDNLGRWMTVNSDHVNVRAGWGTSYTVIGEVTTGDHACVTGGHDDDRDRTLRWWVFDYHGRPGWIDEEYVDLWWWS
ncbi:MAG: hypothetical protein ACRDRT_15140 [Pseudonocardiaceae bacterium]